MFGSVIVVKRHVQKFDYDFGYKQWFAIMCVKSNRGAEYSKETHTIVVELVKGGSLTSYRASKIYKIPKNTLTDDVKGRRDKLSSSCGRRTDFTPEEETSVTDCIRCLEKWGFGLTRKELQDDNSLHKTGASFQDLILKFIKPDQIPIKQPRKRVCLEAEVITQKDVTHFQQKIEEKNVPKKNKIVQKKKNIVQQKKTRKTSSDESDVDSWLSDSSSDRISEFDDMSDDEMEEKRVAEFSKNNSNSNSQSRDNNKTVNNDETQILTIQILTICLYCFLV
ncbi:hypothetical protein QE152_g39723 [Popillia japonica]|uniref:HTH psq-type domain-containing protein n=1 Tax=Popillia japonica TaxID=7064 RepID=A0AAW1HT89_POPJA